jgi:hypothetical protein
LPLLIDDTLATAFATVPFSEGWLETAVEVQLETNLAAGAIRRGDIALVSAAEATLLGETHVIDSSVAVVLDGTGPVAMRTPVRPDEVDNVVVRLLDVGPTGEMLLRALLRPYFGITASGFARSDDDPGASEAQVVVVDGALGLDAPESGFQDDLVRDWFVLTGEAVVSHVLMIGVEALARGAQTEVDLLRQAIATAQERRKDTRRVAAERWGVGDRDALATMTNRQRFELTQADRHSLATMVTRGAWGSRFQNRLPAYRDSLPDDVRGETID